MVLLYLAIHLQSDLVLLCGHYMYSFNEGKASLTSQLDLVGRSCPFVPRYLEGVSWVHAVDS